MPALTQANLRRLEVKDPVAAALASIVSSLPPSDTTPIPEVEVANAKVKAWSREAMKGKGKDAALGPTFRATWEGETFEIPYGEMAGRRRPNCQSGSLTGCLKNVHLRRNRRNMNACSLAQSEGGGTRTHVRGMRFAPMHGSP